MVKLPKEEERKRERIFYEQKKKEREREEIEKACREKRMNIFTKRRKNRATERKKGDEIESIRDLSRKIEGVRLSLH